MASALQASPMGDIGGASTGPGLVEEASLAPISSEAPCPPLLGASCDAADASRIANWVLSGRHVIEQDRPKCTRTRLAGSFSIPYGYEGSDASPASSSSLSSSAPSSTDQLVGLDDDLLVPTAKAIDATFQSARQTWSSLLARARALPPVRELNENAVWRIRAGDYSSSSAPARDEDDDVLPISDKSPASYLEETVSGEWTRTRLRKDMHPAFVQLVPVAASNAKVKEQRQLGWEREHHHHRGIGILTLCWAYIISALLSELQGDRLIYTKASIALTPLAVYEAGPADVVLDLGSQASGKLVRWLCAVLAPKAGWFTSSKPRRPSVWAAHVDGTSDVRIVILVDMPAAPVGTLDEEPPDSSRARELLVELCELLGLGAGDAASNCESEVMVPSTTAFMAALALPLFEGGSLGPPELVVSSLWRHPSRKAMTRRQQQSNVAHVAGSVRQLVADLPYYMTLSASDWALRPVIWNVFWQPGIDCNLAGPWLSGILDVLRPVIDAGDISTLVSTFACRRPSVALWWVGLFALINHNRLLEDMVLWLQTSEGRLGGWGLGWGVGHDITAAAWTGVPNPLLDQDGEADCCYESPEDLVPRAEVYRCRYNLCMRSKAWNLSTTPWHPFGNVAKKNLELDIWPWLEQRRTRHYQCWVWWIGHSLQHASGVRDVQLGFSKDKGNVRGHFHDDLEVLPPVAAPLNGNSCSDPVVHDVRKHPSIVAVGHMLAVCIRDVRCQMHEDIAAMPGFEKHKWQKNWNILPSCW